MSGVIYNGNIVNNFGKFLPRPIIERVEVHDKKLIVTLSVYLINDSIDPPTATISDLEGNLKFYLCYAMDSNQIENVINKETNIFEVIGDSATGKIYIPPAEDAAARGETYYPFFGYWNWISINTQLVVGSGTWVETTTNDEGQSVFKYSSNHDIYFGDFDEVYEFADFNDSATDLGQILEGYKNIMLFAFSSLLDMNASGYGANRTIKKVYTTNLPEGNINYLEDKAYYTGRYPAVTSTSEVMAAPLIDAQTSDISYMSIFKNGMIDTDLMNVYVEASGVRYETTPLKGFNGRYYPTELISRDQIQTVVQELLDKFEPLRAEDDSLNNMMDAVSYVLGAHKRSVDFLIELKQLLEVWPSRVTSTPVGRLFKDYQQVITTINSILIRAGPLHRQLSQNFKVIDKRETPPGPGVQEGYDANILSGYAWTYRSIAEAHNGQGLGDTSYIFPNFLVSRQTYDDNDDLEWNINSGFFFFDYEKALYTDTVLSKTYDVSRIENWFGRELTNYGLMFKNAEVRHQGLAQDRRYAPTFDGSDQINEIAVYSSDPAILTVDARLRSSPTDWTEVPNEREFPLKYGRIDDLFSADTHDDQFLPITENGFGSEQTTDTDYSCLYNVPFNFASSVSLGDYRMACFYFQDYWRRSLDYNDLGVPYYESEWYKAKIQLEDNSSHIPLALMRDFADAYGQLLGYLDGAEDNCSYDNINGYFNEFFVTAMNEKYKEDMTQAPWNRAVTTLYLHMDLVENMFGQNYTALVDAAKKQIARINPETGTLEQLRRFKAGMEVFWNKYYVGHANNNTVMGALKLANRPLDPLYDDDAEDYLPYLPNSAPSDSQMLTTPSERLAPVSVEYEIISDLLPPVYTELTVPACEDGWEWDYDEGACVEIAGEDPPKWQKVGSSWRWSIYGSWDKKDSRGFAGYGLLGCKSPYASDECSGTREGGAWWPDATIGTDSVSITEMQDTIEDSSGMSSFADWSSLIKTATGDSPNWADALDQGLTAASEFWKDKRKTTHSESSTGAIVYYRDGEEVEYKFEFYVTKATTVTQSGQLRIRYYEKK